MYAIYGNMYHQYTPNVIAYIPYAMHGSYGLLESHAIPLTRQYKGMLVGGLEHESYFSIYWK